MCVLHAANIPLATTILPPRKIDIVISSLNINIPIMDAKNNWKYVKLIPSLNDNDDWVQNFAEYLTEKEDEFVK